MDTQWTRRRLICSATVGLAAMHATVRAVAATTATADGNALLERAVKDLVIANRILADQHVVDAYGHISLRHPLNPKQFLISRSRSPELVEPADIVTLDLKGNRPSGTGPSLYLERFIHAAVLSARPDVNVVIHAHATEVLPFTVTDVPLVPVIQNAGTMGETAPPLWDIATKFGDTNLLVVNMQEAEDLAATMGNANVVLMRGHGFAAAGRSLIEALRIAVYLRMNAAVLTEALKLGTPKALSTGETQKIRDVAPDAPELRRAWEYWAKRAGCADLL